MSWVAWAALLIVWPVVGLAVAYLFGRFTHRGEVYGNVGELSPPVVSYLRRAKRSKVASRITSQVKHRREVAGVRRVH